MADRVSADHPSVETIRATLARRGGTQRPSIHLPADAESPPEEGVVRLVLDDTQYHAPVAESGDGGRAMQGAYESPRLARERSGADYLPDWVADHDLSVGRSVHVDVVVPDVRYGLRAPGDTATYDASEPPAEGLQDLARDLEG